MWQRTRVSEILGLKYPILQAPMSGGPTTVELVAAVSNAGALGSLGAGYLTAENFRNEIREIRKRTSAPFGVNLFIFDDTVAPDLEELRRANLWLDGYRVELGLPKNPALPMKFCEPIAQQLSVVLEEAPPVFSFTFGVPPSEFLEACRRKKIITIGTATHFAEAIALENAGVDMLFAQGAEAGGHRGTFIGSPRTSLVPIRQLVPEIRAKVKIPVIAAGGLMNGKDIADLLKLGAEGAMLGTAFLLTDEAGTSAPYRKALQSTEASFTEITRAFSGREARGIKNRFLEEMASHEALVPAYPFQNALTRDIRQEAARAGRAEFLSLWAGTNARAARAMPAAELVEVLARETAEDSSVQTRI